MFGQAEARAKIGILSQKENMTAFIHKRFLNGIFITPAVLSLALSFLIAPLDHKNISFGGSSSLQGSSKLYKVESLPRDEFIRSSSAARFADYRADGKKEKQTFHNKDFSFERISRANAQAIDRLLSEFKNSFVSFKFCLPQNKAPPLLQLFS